MKELFGSLSSYLDKIHKFFNVIWEKILDVWETVNIISSFLPGALVAVFITAIVLIIVLRILNR